MADSAQLLRESWKGAVAAGDEFPRLFYAVLFDAAPSVAALFPPDMREQRRHLVATLGNVVKAAQEDEIPPGVTRRLEALGRDHRRFGAEPEHYPVVGEALILTLSHFSQGWTPEHEQAWGAAFGMVAEVMACAAGKLTGPPWLDLDVQAVGTAQDLVSLVVAPPEDWPDGYGPGLDCWARRPDRPTAWVRGRMPSGLQEPTVLAVIHRDDLDAIVLSQTPKGAQVRLAPVFDQEALHA
jgi:hemoglobin-like flavoprotein